MSHSTQRPQPHKCLAHLSNESRSNFCAYCGLYLSKIQARNFYRSQKHVQIDFYRLDANLILSDLIRKQSFNRYYNGRACHLAYRQSILAFIEEVTEKLGYREGTLHLSVALLDCFLSSTKVDTRMIRLYSFIAVMTAGKLEENDSRVPDMASLMKLFGKDHTLEELEQCEVTFVRILKFRLRVVTPFSFIEFFLSKGVCSDLDLISIRLEKREAVLARFESYVSHFAKVALASYSFYEYTSIALATAAIACARRAIGFTEIWNEDLEALTRVSWPALKSCSSALFRAAKDINLESLNQKMQGKRENISNDVLPSKARSQTSVNTDCRSERDVTTVPKMEADNGDEICCSRKSIGNLTRDSYQHIVSSNPFNNFK